MPFPIEEWYYEVPIVTRSYVTAVFLTTLACQLELVSPFHLYFDWSLIWKGGQWWRLVTSFLYFGSFSLDFLFHLFFLVRYSRMLEEGSFRGRTADFVWFLGFGMSASILLTPLIPSSLAIPFLSAPLTFMLVYVWSRRNSSVRMNFLGVFNFNAPYLPWVLMGFTVLLNSHWPVGDLVGLLVGHVYYFLEDVYPGIPHTAEWRPLRAP
ncbi:Derlin, partial [Fimicolochytrium jonesii]|uniref:Derlin n=1 Tax=Fimicolochytrium jonesii TaxID=1396493 RepID=UPI0022FE2D75